MVRIAINGLGRIGRAALKIAVGIDGIGVAAVNDRAPEMTRRAVPGIWPRRGMCQDPSPGP